MSQVTTAFSAQDSKLYIRISGVFVEITQLKNLNGPGIQDNLANISCLSSPGGFEEVKPLMKKPTPVTGDLIWNPADTTHHYLRQSKVTYPATLERFMEVASDPNQETCLFSGYVTKFDPKLSSNDVGMVALEVTPTGQPTIYYGSSPA